MNTENAADFETRLATPLASLQLPTRLANALQRKGLQTIGELVRLSPDVLLSEPNLGRKSIYDARNVIQLATGATWEEARRALLGAASLSPPPSSSSVAWRDARWEAYRARLAPAARTLLCDLDLPARVYTFTNARSIETLGGLLSLSWNDFAESKNVGRGTIAATLTLLDDLVRRVGLPESEVEAPDGEAELPNRSVVPLLPDGARWHTLLRDALATLEGQDRIIATQRAGLAGPIPTLQELGDCFGVSRERIRQLESRAIERLRKRVPRAEVSRRLDEACELLISEPEAVGAREPLFAFEPDEVPALLFFVNEILSGTTQAFLHDEQLVYARAKKSVLTAHLRRVRTLLEEASFPAEEDDLARSIAAALEIGIADVRELFAYLDEPVMKEGSRIVGFGRRREDEVLAALRAAAGPLERSDIETRFGRGRLPGDAVFVDHGLVSVAEKIEGWDRWLRRLPPIVRRIIEREGPERQWSTEELVDLLATECELPDWMNAWTLGSLLRRSPDVEYLGRNVVALPSAPSSRSADAGEPKRVYVAPALEEILRAHGGPMPEDDAREALTKIRGLSMQAWNLMRMKAPFLLLDGATLGLYPRDVPGGEARAKKVLDPLHVWLAAEQAGLPAPDVRRFLTELGEVAEGISPRMFRSIARLDGRFRLSVCGAIGLAQWESVRVPTQAEMLEALLEEGGGAVPVDVVCARILTSAGEPLSRPMLANLAIRVGARLDGPLVLRRTDEEIVMRSPLVANVVADLPERTTVVFERLLDEVAGRVGPAPLDQLANELEGWASSLREHAATDAPHIELEQLESILIGTRALLSRAAHLEGEAWALALAAVRYVVCTDDADTDLSVGGLDDDEAVLARVSAALGVS